MKHRRSKCYGIILTQTGVVVCEVKPNKLEVAKGLKRCIGRMSFVDVLKAIAILARFENFLKCRLMTGCPSKM